MDIVVIGLGEVGRHLIDVLAPAGHDIVAIDSNEAAVHYIEENYDVATLSGYGAGEEILEKAGAATADLVVAVTNNDEVNLIAALAAKHAGAKRAIARVQRNDWGKTRMGVRKNLLGIDVAINPSVLVAQELVKVARSHGAVQVIDLAQHRIELVQVEITGSSRFIHRPVSSLPLPNNTLIAAIVRNGDLFVPGGSDNLLPEDRVYLIGQPADVLKAEDLFTSKREAKRACIVGGGVTGEMVAHLLQEEGGVEVLIIESSKERAETLSASLDNVTVLHGDGTDMRLLTDEEVGSYDIFAAVTADDELNLMAALLAQRLGSPRTAALVHRPDYTDIYKQLGVDVVVSPRTVASDHILRYCRQSELQSLTVLQDGQAEVLELLAREGSRAVGTPLRRLNLPRGALIGAIVPVGGGDRAPRRRRDPTGRHGRGARDEGGARDRRAPLSAGAPVRRYRDFRGVLRPVGAVVIGLSVFIALTALVGWLFDLAAHDEHVRTRGGEWALVGTAALTLFTGVGLLMYGRRHASDFVSRREAVLAVSVIWAAASLFGALPFVVGASMSPIDALFETVSGLTTTGATVVTDIEGSLSRPILLWRSLLQWLGGMGIVVLFVAVFPSIGAGGKHMFGEEVPGTTVEGLRPRIAETSRVLWQLYVLFTVLVIASLWALGVSLFEAVCHAFTTMSTGGFSTRDASIGAFDDWRVELLLSGFMLVASVNYGLYYAALRGKTLRVFPRSVEFRTYVAIVFTAVIATTIGILPVHGGDLFAAFRYGLFTVATFVSSTGYGTDDYTTYPPSVLWVILTLMFVGGCAGSTAGGIKIERIVLMAKVVWTELRRSFRPNLVHVVRMGRQIVQPSALTDVVVFFVVYMASLAVMTGTATLLDGLPLPAAFGASLSCLSNMGPAPFHVGADNFASYSSATKFVFTLGMLLGRLEFFALLALLVPGFWRR
jgi:trk system potassium uptake protein TrkH